MKYRKIKDLDVSVLGLGCMRLPTKNVDGKNIIDEDKFTEMVQYSYDNGVNYFDTAYMYHEGTSENYLGRVLNKLGIREKVYVADKLPPWNVTCKEDVEKLFNEQLEKSQTDYFDFYLLHSMTRKFWDEKIKKFDVLEVLLKLKEEGKIKLLGFSFHDDLDAFKYIIDDSKDIIDFCQIQLNYVDAAAKFQAGIEGLEYAYKNDVAVVVMEPLKGGELATLSEHVSKNLPTNRSQVETALDFLWDRKEVAIVLSGMGDMDQLRENIMYANRAEVDMLGEKEKEMIMKAGDVFNKGANVQCTACEYCLPCPAGINIPQIFKLYNMNAVLYSWDDKPKKKYMELERKADDCIKCRKCEGHCPQNLKISEIMTEIADVMK